MGVPRLEWTEFLRRRRASCLPKEESTPLSFEASHVIDAPRELVWQWHTRPGALARLVPPFLPMTPRRQAERLSDGTTVLGFPAGLTWVARHDLSRYQRGRSFADVCINAPMRKLANWRHTHTFADFETASAALRGERTLITDTVDTRIPASALTPMFAYRQRQLIADFDFLARVQSINGAARPLTVAMTGSRGAVGRALTAQLTTAGHTVIQLVRSKAKEGQRVWNPANPAPDLLADADVLIHLAGEPIFGRFNDSHKAAIRDSRVGPTRKLAELVSRTPSVKTFVSASAIGYYGPDRGDELLTESSDSGDGFLAEVCRDWEAATAPAADAARVVQVRTGVALTGNAGLLPLLRALFQTGLGGTFGNGDFWLSWIAHDDLTDIYFRAAIDDSLTGPVNAVGPTPVLNRDMAHLLAKELGRPAIIPIPTLGPALLLGREGAQELALANQRVASEKLSPANHTYRFETMAAALAHELGGEELVALPAV